MHYCEPNPPHPGDVLLERFLVPMNLCVDRLAADLQLPAEGLREIVDAKRPVTIETALGLARKLGTSAEYWIRLQSRYDQAAADRSA